MQDINPQGFSNPVLSAATSGDVEAARQNMINAFADAAQLFADRGVHKLDFVQNLLTSTSRKSRLWRFRPELPRGVR